MDQRKQRQTSSTSGLRHRKNSRPGSRKTCANKRRGSPRFQSGVEEAETGSLTSNAAWGSSSIKASVKLRKNLPGKQCFSRAH